MDTTKAVTHVSLCAGYGGIDLGLRRAIPDLRTIAVAEIEAFACANLVAKMEAGQLDPAPIWTDLKTFPWRKFHGCVDILSGGYPCQPFSAAGKRLGADDPRHLWPFIAAGIAAMRPAVCFFENVEGHISLGLEQVLRDLQGLGYRCTFGIFSASEVGATHQRKRLFILAHCASTGLERLRAYARQSLKPEFGDSCSPFWPSRPGQPQFAWEPPRVVADAKRDGSGKGGQLCAGPDGQQPVSDGEPRGTDGMGNTRVQESRWLPSGSGRNEAPEVGQSGGAMGDTESQRSTTQRAKHEGLGGQLCAASASGKGVVGDTKRAERRADDNWVTGEADKGSSDASSPDRRQTEPALGGDADGSAGRLDYAQLCISDDSRVDELRLLGNGVVPATAERAFNVLASRLFS